MKTTNPFDNLEFPIRADLIKSSAPLCLSSDFLPDFSIRQKSLYKCSLTEFFHCICVLSNPEFVFPFDNTTPWFIYSGRTVTERTATEAAGLAALLFHRWPARDILTRSTHHTLVALLRDSWLAGLCVLHGCDAKETQRRRH